MKQGSASRDGAAGQKREPIPHAVRPGGVSQLGSMQGNHATGADGVNPRGGSEPLYGGRGYSAPMAGQTNHGNSGSQKHHK